MIVSKNVRCNNCDREYRLRYSVGNNFPQSATFYCKKCGISLAFGISNGSEPISQGLTILKGYFEAEVINLHPEIPMDADKESDQFYFPNIEFMRDDMAKDNFVGFRRAQVSNVLHYQKWKGIADDFRLLVEERWDILIDKYKLTQTEIEKKIIDEVFKTCEIFLEGRWESIYDEVIKALDTAKNSPDFPQLLVFWEQYRQEFLSHKLYELMRQYHDVSDYLLPTLLSQKLGYKPEGLSSSIKWEKIEKIYGDFYEVYGDLLIIPACINNLLVRNNHELFQTPNFTIHDFIETDKAGRCNNFIGNAQLTPLGDFYSASLRNGTHHKTARINKGKQKIILKTGKGGKNEEVWSFVSYSEYCNEIYARCLILFLVFRKALT
jgi:hypothetical protein